MSSPGVSILQSLLFPEAPAQFFQDHWQKSARYIQGAPAKFAGFFGKAAFNDALPHCEVLKAAYKDPRGWTVDVPIQASQAAKMFEAGMTVCAGRLRGNAVLDSFLRGFRKEVLMPGTVYFNCYHSPDGAGFGLHLDDHPVFILQIEGSKRWWFSVEPGVPNPPRGFSFPPGLDELNVPWGRYRRPDESAFSEVVLKPGDVLYLPAGCWHRAAGVGESLALTLAVFGGTPLDLVRLALGKQLARVPGIQQSLAGIWAPEVSTEQIPEQLRATFDTTLSGLRTILAEMTDEDLYRAWRAAAEEG